MVDVVVVGRGYGWLVQSYPLRVLTSMRTMVMQSVMCWTDGKEA